LGYPDSFLAVLLVFKLEYLHIDSRDWSNCFGNVVKFMVSEGVMKFSSASDDTNMMWLVKSSISLFLSTHRYL